MSGFAWWTFLGDPIEHVLSVVRIWSGLRPVCAAQAFAVPYHLTLADGDHGAQPAISLEPALAVVQESEASCLHFDDRNVGETTLAERRQFRAPNSTGGAHRNPFDQILDPHAHVQKLRKCRHHVGSRQQETGLVYAGRQDVGKESLSHRRDGVAEPEAAHAVSKIEQNSTLPRVDDSGGQIAVRIEQRSRES